jgi:DnaJ-class molecular chaperone
MDLNKDYYAILGLPKNANEQEIKKTYKTLAKKHHPDKGGDQEKFKIISEAHSVLSSDDKVKYDTQSPHGNNYSPYNNGWNIFSSWGNTNRNYEQKENLNININVIITLSDVYKGEPINVKYKRNISCKTCNGTGFKGKEKCDKCNGEGVIINDENFDINNIQNYRHSFTEVLHGYGHVSRRNKSFFGSCILNINFQNMNGYSTNERGELIYNLDIHYSDAISGFKYKYNCLDGTEMIVNIPEKTKDKDMLRLKGKGLLLSPPLYSLNTRSDLYFKINIIIDYKRMVDEKEKEKQTKNQEEEENEQ